MEILGLGMLRKISDVLYPPAGAPSASFIRAGLINLLMAGVVFSLFGIYMFVAREHGAVAPPPYAFIGLILWMVGIHYLLWRGSASEVVLVNVGKVIITAIAGFVSMLVVAGGLGAFAGMIARLFF